MCMYTYKPLLEHHYTLCVIACALAASSSNRADWESTTGRRTRWKGAGRQGGPDAV